MVHSFHLLFWCFLLCGRSWASLAFYSGVRVNLVCVGWLWSLSHNIQWIDGHLLLFWSMAMFWQTTGILCLLPRYFCFSLFPLLLWKDKVGFSSWHVSVTDSLCEDIRAITTGLCEAEVAVSSGLLLCKMLLQFSVFCWFLLQLKFLTLWWQS